MNLEHLRAILWLRWKMSSNQWRRLGTLNAVVTTGIVIGAIAASFVLFFAALIGGSVVLATTEVEPDVLMFVWDVIVLLFLFVWCIGLVTELQRSELLSLDKLLHLPLSLSGTFFLNYASSLLSLPMIVFLPGMLGFALACIVAYGWSMLTILPLLLSFMLFVTALTYQFRGWLATLMQNKRRRKSIIVAITLLFILLVQAPQLINITVMSSSSRRNSQQSQEHTQKINELTQLLASGEITPEENTRRMEVLKEERKQRRKDGKARFYDEAVSKLLLANQVLPIGWFPYGARAGAMGNPLPGILGSVALFGIGALSLWRSYATTMRFYTGSRGKAKKVVKKPQSKSTREPSNGLAAKIPFLSEQVATVTLCGFRTTLRAPESKMALLTPVIMVCIFGGVIVAGPGRELRNHDVQWATPFIGLAIIGVMLFGLAQLMINIFGMDRGGFRAFVLMPVERHNILIGKNLSVVPIAACIAVILIVVLQVIFRMRFTHLVATLVQLVPTYLMFCLAGNAASIFAPMAVATGSLKPAQPALWPILVQMFFTMFAPLALVPAAVALGAETVLAQTTDINWLPIYLLFTLIEAAFAVWIYCALIKVQGQWLQKRETRILETLAKVPE